MVVEASEEFHQKGPGKDFDPEPPDKMLAQDPLEEIDFGEGLTKKLTYISANINPQLKFKVIQLLNEFKECFVWDYDEMPSLSKDLVELKLLIKFGKNPIKQNPGRFAPTIISKIK
ncbi:hypothetical protein KIW84_071985 [Lathyrus oleraceus]|uniref:Reverse transcriptase domain-containing protein n=1 Tax=Pisum sativum TaxID=3888 RepID=A0A9D4ZVF7_PEA|nr:hypothetical protein KIW84_071985 [Pisum sativum]